MSSGFIEVTLRAELDPGDLLALLHDEYALGSWEENGTLHIYWPEKTWSEAVLEDLIRVLTHFGTDIQGACVTVNRIPDRDWNAVWTASLQPIRIGRQLRVRQSWHASDAGFAGIELVIDPKRAFGSGHHATTQLIMQWLEEKICGGERVLDIGTGSGILAMAALRLGAASALAIDIDPIAVECARECAALNGFGGELELRVASFENLDREGFEVVVANLDNRSLPLLSRSLRRLLTADGIACLSGLQKEDYEEAVRYLLQAGMQPSACKVRDEWLALEVQGSGVCRDEMSPRRD